jgi:hypothetical protein
LTVPQVRVVTSCPNAVSINYMNTGVLALEGLTPRRRATYLGMVCIK